MADNRARNQLRKERNSDQVKKKLQLITATCKTNTNLLPLIIDAAKSYATLGEIVDSMREVFGEWRENPVI